MTQDSESPNKPPDEPETENTELGTAVDDLWSSLKRIGRVIRKEMANPARTAIERVADGADELLGGFAGDKPEEKKRR